VVALTDFPPDELPVENGRVRTGARPDSPELTVVAPLDGRNRLAPGGTLSFEHGQSGGTGTGTFVVYCDTRVITSGVNTPFSRSNPKGADSSGDGATSPSPLVPLFRPIRGRGAGPLLPSIRSPLPCVELEGVQNRAAPSSTSSKRDFGGAPPGLRRLPRVQRVERILPVRSTVSSAASNQSPS
jgi:hypothetical protein